MPPPEPLHAPASGVIARMPSTPAALCWALAYLGTAVPLAHRPAVVLDVDGTVLRNTSENQAKCVVAFRPFVRACTQAGVEIFVVTARPDFPSNRRWTENQLQSCEIPFAELYMKPEDADTSGFKHAARESIRRSGRTVLLSVGDQFHDLAQDARKDLEDDAVLVGQLGDGGSYGIKLPSEFD